MARAAGSTVAGVAEARQDVAPIVEALVEGGGVDVHLGVRVPQVLDAFGGRDEGARPR